MTDHSQRFSGRVESVGFGVLQEGGTVIGGLPIVPKSSHHQHKGDADQRNHHYVRLADIEDHNQGYRQKGDLQAHKQRNQDPATEGHTQGVVRLYAGGDAGAGRRAADYQMDL